MTEAVNPGRGGGIGEKLTRLLVTEMRSLAEALGERATFALREQMNTLTDRLTEYAEKSGDPAKVAVAKGAQELSRGASPLKAALSGALAGGKEKIKQAFGKGKGKSKKLKLTNIVEFIDVGVPLRVAYNQWTEFEDFPRFMKKVEKVDRASDEKLNWRAQIFLSHRDWESTTVEQIPDERIVWRSTGAKGYVNGAISFHAVTPTLTRIVLVMEYYPKGLFEHTGNLWRAQGRRTRLELKHFVRHVMTQTILHPEEVEGWRGVIRDGEVVLDHDTAMRQEREQHRTTPAERPDNRRAEEG